MQKDFIALSMRYTVARFYAPLAEFNNIVLLDYFHKPSIPISYLLIQLLDWGCSTNSSRYSLSM